MRLLTLLLVLVARMALGAYPASDTFPGPGPGLGGNWTNPFSTFGTFQIPQANRVQPSSTANGTYVAEWTFDTTVSPPGWSYITLGPNLGSQVIMGVCVGMATRTACCAANTTTAQVWELGAGGISNQDTTTSVSFVAGDQVGIVWNDASHVSCFKRAGGVGSWTSTIANWILSTSLTDPGQFGIMAFAQATTTTTTVVTTTTSTTTSTSTTTTTTTLVTGFLPRQVVPSGALGAQAPTAARAAGSVTCAPFTLEYGSGANNSTTLAVGHILFGLYTRSATTNAACGYCVYDATGATKILDAGGQTCDGTQQQWHVAPVASPATLNAGTRYIGCEVVGASPAANDIKFMTHDPPTTDLGSTLYGSLIPGAGVSTTTSSVGACPASITIGGTMTSTNVLPAVVGFLP